MRKSFFEFRKSGKKRIQRFRKKINPAVSMIVFERIQPHYFVFLSYALRNTKFFCTFAPSRANATECFGHEEQLKNR
jgi:hypothetical protein